MKVRRWRKKERNRFNSNLVGAKINKRGLGIEFPLCEGFKIPNLFSFAINNKAGIRNANVFPDPVAAIPIASRPVNKIGQHWDYQNREKDEDIKMKNWREIRKRKKERKEGRVFVTCIGLGWGKFLIWR